MKPLLLVSTLTLLAIGCGSPAPADPRAAAKSPRAMALVEVVTNARFGKILADSRGLTLYLFTPERDGHVVCTRTCTRTWIPLLLSSRQQLAAGMALPGRLGEISRPEGTVQMTYNEYPLYTFAGDADSGDVGGEGKSGEWFVVPEVFPADADHDSDGTKASPMPSPTPPPVVQPAHPSPPAAVGPAPVPTPSAIPTCNFGNPDFNDGDSDNAGNPSDGDGCG